MPLFRRSEEFSWFWRIIPSFLDSSHFSSVCNDLGRGNRESAKSELRNQESYEAYKQFHFHEATSNLCIGSRLWHLGDNKQTQQPKKLPPISFFFLRVFHKVRLWNYNSDRLPTPSRETGKGRKFCDGSGSWTRENELLKNFMFLRPKIYKLPRPNPLARLA